MEGKRLDLGHRDFRTIDVIVNPANRFLVTVKYQIGVSRSKQNRHLRMTIPMACQHTSHIVLPARINHVKPPALLVPSQ
jgi:hypothetical protein